MKSDSKKLPTDSESLATVGWLALLFGTVFAFASYLLALIPGDEWMQSSYLYNAEHDSLFKFVLRFLLGAMGGAVIGTVHTIRERRDRKNKG